ncbi:hypothetical protein AB4305_16455 [Nocardia sp. 2YAB30]|uniref:hypothetical protein n=1 Tax=unclassified Nocardia TaxID=2637762 RepID=UPI003F9A4C68
MTYADVLTNAAVLDPHAWSDTSVWTVALDSTEARRRGRSSGSGGSIWVGILCIGLVVVGIGLAIWLGKRKNSNQPQQPYAPQQYPQSQPPQYQQPYPPQQDQQAYPPQQGFGAPPQYQQPYPPQPQQYQPPQQQYQPPFPPQQ